VLGYVGLECLVLPQLGEADITTTLGTYGHLYPDDLDALADALDDTYRHAVAGKARPLRALEVVPIDKGKRRTAP
jgi:hypothetical protein